MKYRKKPLVIEAMKWEGQADVLSWVADNGTREVSADYQTKEPTLTIHTLEGDMKANFGDWIIKGIKGEFYPCKPKIFEAMYEEVKGE